MQNGPKYAAGENITYPRINQCMTCFAWCFLFCFCCCCRSALYFMPLPFLFTVCMCLHVCIACIVCDCFDSLTTPPPPFISTDFNTYSTIFVAFFLSSHHITHTSWEFKYLLLFYFIHYQQWLLLCCVFAPF